jgi:hypothetical protein
MTYKILPDNRIRLDFGDFVQTMTREEFAAYMRPYRDDDPDYYAQLVHAYILLTRSAWRP